MFHGEKTFTTPSVCRSDWVPRSPNPLLFQVDLVTLIFRSLTQPMAILKGYMMRNYGHLAGILKGYLFEIKKPQKS